LVCFFHTAQFNPIGKKGEIAECGARGPAFLAERGCSKEWTSIGDYSIHHVTVFVSAESYLCKYCKKMNKYMKEKKYKFLNLRIFWNCPMICRHYFCSVIYVSTHSM
jgi:hypothetical protein